MQSSTLTFEEALVPGSLMEGRIREVTRRLPWLVLEDGRQIHGCANATEWKSRSADRYAVESTVYVAREFIGAGVGTQLLHEKLGFKKVAHFRELGWKMNRWRDLGYWELLL